jgi:hypothetical protein
MSNLRQKRYTPFDVKMSKGSIERDRLIRFDQKMYRRNTHPGDPMELSGIRLKFLA